VTVLARNQWILIVLVGTVGAAFVLGDGERLLDPRLYQGMFREHPDATAAIFFGVYVLCMAFSLPVTAALSIVSGIIFGHAIGIPLALSACTLGGTLAFLFSRYVLHGLVQQRFAVQLAVINKGIERDGSFYLVSMRMIPVIPFWLINLLMGLTPITTTRFFLASLLGMVPIIAIYVHFGVQLGGVRAFSLEEVFTPNLMLALALLATLPFLTRGLLKLMARLRAARARAQDAGSGPPPD